MSIEMSQTEFKKLLAASGSKVEDSPTDEIPVRLVLYRPSRMRVAHWAMIVWAVFTIMTGSWFSLPLIVLWLIACWDIHHTNTGIEELLAGLNQAGVIDTPTKETAFAKRARIRAEKEQAGK